MGLDFDPGQLVIHKKIYNFERIEVYDFKMHPTSSYNTICRV